MHITVAPSGEIVSRPCRMVRERHPGGSDISWHKSPFRACKHCTVSSEFGMIAGSSFPRRFLQTTPTELDHGKSRKSKEDPEN